LFRVQVSVDGEIADHRPLLILSNHSSWLDIVVLSSVMPMSFIAKSDVAAWPVFGTFARLQRSIFVERERRSATKRAVESIQTRMRGGDAIVLFAEGTTNDGNRVLPFKSALVGAVQDGMGEAGCVVQPVLVTYKSRGGLPIGRKDRPAISWYGDMTLLSHLGGIIGGGPIEAAVVFCPPIPATGDDRLPHNRKVLTKSAEQAVRQALTETMRRGQGSLSRAVTH
jgi:1-acyl-sn-glycerol-3-phosphate acyltransferase